MELGFIKNGSISASSTLGPDFRPWFGRLNANMKGGGWCARVNNKSQYMEMSLIDQYKIRWIMIQGVGSSWVDKYSLDYSLDGFTWTAYQEQSTQVCLIHCIFLRFV